MFLAEDVYVYIIQNQIVNVYFDFKNQDTTVLSKMFQ